MFESVLVRELVRVEIAYTHPKKKYFNFCGGRTPPHPADFIFFI
jgi:hypothetical protein